MPAKAEGIGGLDAGVQRAHETDEEMRLVQAGLDKDGIHFYIEPSMRIHLCDDREVRKGGGVDR